MIDLEHIENLLVDDFPLTRSQKLHELCQYRVDQAAKYKTARGKKIENWASHKSLDDFFNQLNKQLPEVGITCVERRVKSYRYSELQTEHFRFYPFLKSTTNQLRIHSPIVKRYTTPPFSPLLFPEETKSPEDDKIPCILLYSRFENETIIKSFELSFFEECTVNPYFSYNLLKHVLDEKTRPSKLQKENLPPAISLIKIRESKKVEKAE